MRLPLVLLLLSVVIINYGQNLKPGYDQAECEEMFKITARFGTENYYREFELKQGYQFVYRSAPVGLDNCWDLWTKDNKTAVISIRGTTLKSESWLANFYAAMVPAQGSVQIDKEENFEYDLAKHPRAAVHVGWMLSTAYLAKDIKPKLDSCYQAGIRNVIVTGQSQGGAIAYLVTAYLYGMQRNSALAKDVRIKTYCFAAPKPGNIYFAYEYESLTGEGWSYSIQNAADWVPQLPISVQTLDDFNTTNPFRNAKKVIRKMGFPKNLALKHVYNKLDKPTRKAVKNYQKYLGKMIGNQVKIVIPEFESPEYYNSNDYCRTGNTIILMPDAEYYSNYPDDEEKIFVHHLHQPYYFMLEKLNFSTVNGSTIQIDGAWVLEQIIKSDHPINQSQDRLPEIKFDSKSSAISGYNSCNEFFGSVTISNSTLEFKNDLASTRKFCEGSDEELFMNNLSQVNNYTIKSDRLELKNGDEVLMIFRRI